MAQSSSDSRKAAADALAGVFASLIALWVFYPIDVLKTRVQAGKSDQKQQPASWLSGLEWKSLHTACSSGVYFYLYSWIQSYWERHVAHRRIQSQKGARTAETPVSVRLLLAAIAAMINTLVTCPLDVISAQKQTSKPESDQFTNKNVALTNDQDLEMRTSDSSTNLMDDDDVDNVQESEKSIDQARPRSAVMEWKRKIVEAQSLWKGVKPSLILCSNPALHYSVFDSIKQRVLSSRSNNNASLSMIEAFVLGLVAKFVATISTYPLIRAKVMLMVTSKSSILQCLRDEYRAGGIKNLYTGCDLQLLHTLLKSALLMMIRERLSKTTRQLLLKR